LNGLACMDNAHDLQAAMHGQARMALSCVFPSGAIRGLLYVEWDEATTPGLDASSYAISEGKVFDPNEPGFGLALEEGMFQQADREGGYALSIGLHR